MKNIVNLRKEEVRNLNKASDGRTPSLWGKNDQIQNHSKLNSFIKELDGNNFFYINNSKMKKKSESLLDNKYLKTGYNICNNVHIFINIVVVVIGIILLYKVYIHDTKNTLVEGEVVSVDKCEISAETELFTNYICKSNVRYKDIEGKEYTNPLESESDELKKGDTIEIYYNNNNPSGIRIRPKYLYLYLFLGIVFMAINTASLVVRIKYKDEPWAQAIIGVMCLGDLINIID